MALLADVVVVNGCYQNHEDGSAVSNACAETSWMMQVGGWGGCGGTVSGLDAGLSGSNSC